MNFVPDLSMTAPRQRPLEVAKDTFVIRGLTPSIGGTWTNLNSMVIAGKEPIVIDTGIVTHREIWFEDVFSLVAPDKLRWIFVTHNDSDHSGNLVEALERCPDAMVVTSHGESFRTHASFGVPFERMRMVNSGESLDIGGHVLRAVRPPVYDSPYTRGVFDLSTRLYYASDAFCAPMPQEPVDRVDEIPEAIWAQSFAKFHHVSLCPWISMVDQRLFEAELGRLAALDIKTIVSAHSPVISGASVSQAFEQLSKLPSFSG